MVKVFSQPGCQPCRLTKAALSRKGVDFVEVDVTEDDAAMAHIKGLGYLSVPVVETETEHWGGLQPDKIAALI